jgi:hypothetical protein
MRTPELVLGEAASVVVVLLTAVGCGLLIVAPLLGAGGAEDVAHSAGVAVGLGVLLLLCVRAVNITRTVPLESRSFPLWLPYAIAIPAFVVFRGLRSVLSAMGFS